MNRLISGTIFILSFLILAAAPVPAWDGLTTSSEHFTIFYHRENAPAAQDLLTTGEREFSRVTGIIGHRPAGVIEIYLAQDPEEFRLLTLGRIPEWGIGAAVPGRRRIVLISPGSSPREADTHKVLVHELSHVVLGQALGDARVPRWLEEGLAMYISHEWRLGQSVLVARALLFDSLIPLERISTVNSFSRARANLAYTESYLAIAFILDRYGETRLHQLVHDLARHGDIDLAMQTSLGLTYREFLMAWNDYVTRRYHWASVLSNPVILWLLILSLFLLAFALKRRHSRRVLRRWKMDEEVWSEPSESEGTEERWLAR
ncbi:peptidase MA family metallohydrolase [Candidatus Zixiibacteriota bacterium]